MIQLLEYFTNKFVKYVWATKNLQSLPNLK